MEDDKRNEFLTLYKRLSDLQYILDSVRDKDNLSIAFGYYSKGDNGELTFNTIPRHYDDNMAEEMTYFVNKTIRNIEDEIELINREIDKYIYGE